MYYEDPSTHSTSEATSAGPGITVYAPWHETAVEAGDSVVEPTREAASGATTLEEDEEFTGTESQLRNRVRLLLANERSDKLLVFPTEQEEIACVRTHAQLVNSLSIPLSRLLVENPSDTSLHRLGEELTSYVARDVGLEEENFYIQDLNEDFARAVDADFVIQFTDGRREVSGITNLESAFEAIGNCRQGEVAWFQWGSERFAPLGSGPEDGGGADDGDRTNDDDKGVGGDAQAQDEVASKPESDIQIELDDEHETRRTEDDDVGFPTGRYRYAWEDPHWFPNYP
jgi:hypothetical protein